MHTLLVIVILTLVDEGYLQKSCPDCLFEICDTNYGICLAGCKEPKWGKYCHIDCPEYCADCYQNSGECSKCHQGKWGKNCERLCPELCLNQECYQTNGSCVRCQSGSWGQRCENLCSDFCLNSTCDINSSKCLNGCEKGRYGDNCNLWCSPGCFDDICLQTGTCISGCKELFYGNQCDKRCSSNCQPSDCHKQTGMCVSCQIGFYGNFCTSICPNCINSTCDKRDGYCIHGCESEWSGYKCDVRKISSISKTNVALVISICSGVVVAVFILIFILRKGGRIWWPRSNRLKFTSSQESDGSTLERTPEISGHYEAPSDVTSQIDHGYTSII
ncbi:scavenger receptor class F member 2-like [Saccostrea cucullata]|uniref:scavenger receptor class F member 2-like n=1 Tax=Saccostrea cuccullata TaxID=36930 RepID=UPI002ED32F21